MNNKEYIKRLEELFGEEKGPRQLPVPATEITFRGKAYHIPSWGVDMSFRIGSMGGVEKDGKIIEVVCKCGVGHPHTKFLKDFGTGASYEGVHGCCGCCRDD